MYLSIIFVRIIGYFCKIEYSKCRIVNNYVFLLTLQVYVLILSQKINLGNSRGKNIILFLIYVGVQHIFMPYLNLGHFALLLLQSILTVELLKATLHTYICIWSQDITVLKIFYGVIKNGIWEIFDLVLWRT